MRSRDARYLALTSAQEATGNNRRVVLTMCAYAAAIGRVLVEPCLRDGFITPCGEQGTLRLSDMFELSALRDVCTLSAHDVFIAEVRSRRAARVHVRTIPASAVDSRYAWPRARMSVWRLPIERIVRDGDAADDNAVDAIVFAKLARWHVWGDTHDTQPSSIYWRRIVAHRQSADLWHRADRQLDAFFPVRFALAQPLLDRLSVRGYDVFHWRSELRPYTRDDANLKLCAATLAEAMRLRLAQTGRPCVLVSDVPLGARRLLSLTHELPAATLAALRRPFANSSVRKADLVPGNWSGDALWVADLHLFAHAEDAFQCTAESPLCAWCGQHNQIDRTYCSGLRLPF